MKTQRRTILHVDMDAFFAAVEQRDRPELRGKPVVVGSPPDKRGVVSTASYEARKFGVHSALPSRIAYQRCPHAIFVPVRGERYAEVSRQVMAIFRDMTPVVEPVSIDEAFLDVEGAQERLGSPVDIARLIKRRIRDELYLTASVGVATNKFLAKLASDLDKPDGLTVVPDDPHDIIAFLAPLPAKKIWGVGKATAERLASRGIRTIGDIQKKTLPEMIALLGHAGGTHVWQLARGVDQRTVQMGRPEEKSVSNEETFPDDVTNPQIVRNTLIQLTEKVGRRLRQIPKTATTGQLKLRFADFKTITRQQPLQRATNADRDLLQCALELLERVEGNQPVRLVGFTAAGLRGPKGEPDEDSAQLMLFRPEPDEETERNQALDWAVDHLRKQYGEDILKRGRW